ncbi:hypothetical protein K437DRAFT_254059 [Tilletiaria anomala UBC 951]|uniref:KOW domain-containing protein n=1 Tax=Tilletiaria anomala (strain ATCC 24038 / CBS 436.72 / UBC 951) TaxID=1037660 RepID=A0A066WPU6_TILAU|nr:uncharacterized protein K437DRAFT_254059 [Tilletiaria anomala UBC 951]KDN52655.1 hypothetical protein K437DRAFT_254059 [Tilletiaria anomala UBC 951]
MATPGTTKTILRNLAHLEPPRKGSKFAFKSVPSYARHTPNFVRPKDRIAYWNIVPGDVVKVRIGKVKELPASTDEGAEDGAAETSRRSRKVRGEGKVVSIDRERNLAWLKDLDQDASGNSKLQLAPRNIRHVIPRLVDPEAGEEKGYGPNVMEVPRPVHYSNLMLKIPDDLLDKKDLEAAPNRVIYARKVTRSRVTFDRRKGMFYWRRYAIYQNPSTNAYERIEVPWPTLPPKRRTKTIEHADQSIVGNESWIPWRPEDPVLLPPEFGTRLGRQRSSVESEAEAEVLRGAHEKRRNELLREKNEAQKDIPDDAAGTYAGFANSRRQHAKLTRPPPIAQAPTPAETISHSSRILSAWASDKDVKRHVSRRGGRAFAASDYLDLAPSFGPASGGDWRALDPMPVISDARDKYTGKLLNIPSQEQVDAFPIELLMRKDLSNEGSLANRMKRWKVKQIEKAQEAKVLAEMEKRNLKVLRELKL